eukprot:4924323-Prymnesium_polylepis.1
MASFVDTSSRWSTRSSFRSASERRFCLSSTEIRPRRRSAASMAAVTFAHFCASSQIGKSSD